MSNPKSDVILEKMMALHPKIIDLTLDRVWRLLGQLDNPQDRLPDVIHLAGTNGKGSTQAMIRAGLEGANKTVHAYTSPHLARFHERIRLAGELIDETALGAILDRCYQANDGKNITYFEITTAAALLAFSETKADFTLLETGLGGRLDATNVVARPKLTIITPISIDHTQFLGDTLSEIAGEKAGILKRGVTCVVGPQPDEVHELIEARAAKLGCPLLSHGQHWHVWEERGRLIFQDENGLLDLPMPALLGEHQVQNAGSTLATLRHLGFGEDACEAAMRDVSWPARMQRLQHGPLVDLAKTAELWLDGGHNPAAAYTMSKLLKTLPKKNTYMICGMLNTKDIAGYMRPFAPVVDQLFAVSIPGEINTLSATETAKQAASAGLNATEAPSVELAISDIFAGDPNARILICGSLYLAGHILKANG